jgi:hypothetical protein
MPPTRKKKIEAERDAEIAAKKAEREEQSRAQDEPRPKHPMPVNLSPARRINHLPNGRYATAGSRRSGQHYQHLGGSAIYHNSVLGG